MSAKTIKIILEDAPELKNLTEHSRHLLQMQQELRDALPAGIASQTVVCSLSSGTLTIATASAPVAAKLRQLSPRILNKLRRKEPKLNLIKIRVQVKADHKLLRKNQIILDHTARNALLNLASKLAISPLRTAVLQLAKSGRPSSNKQESLEKVNFDKNQYDNESNS